MPQHQHSSLASTASVVRAGALAVLILTALALVLPEPGGACSCIAGSFERISESATVFSGTLVSKHRVWFRRWIHRRNTFAVSRVWQGTALSKESVLTGRGNGDCGYRFKRGAEYLVVASRSESGDLHTNICTPTRPLREGDPFVEALGSGEVPPEAQPSFPWLPVLVVVGSSILVLGSAGFGLDRRRSERSVE